MLKNLSIRKKQMGGFFLISAIAVIIAVIGILGLNSVRANFRDVIRTAPLIDAAMEMKIAVARDMQVVMELLAAESKTELKEFWQKHESLVQDYDDFTDAVLNGGETEEGIIQATDNPELREIVMEADRYHNQEFQPKFKAIHEIMTDKIAGRAFSSDTLINLDNEADRIGEKMLTILGSVEDIARETIAESQTKTANVVHMEIITLAIAGLIGVLLSLFLGFIITRAITVPISMANEEAGKIAEGDLTRQMEVEQQDEIGGLLNSLNAMCRNLRDMFKQIKQEGTSLNESSTELSSISNQITANSEQTAEKSTSVASAAEEMNTNMNSIASAIEQTTTNIQMIVSAAEEMTATIQEISGNTTKGSEITESAVREAREMSTKVDELGKAANEIDKVTESITGISDKTNLLALNATIEAARAGEAGKGFAVVAGEIKALSGQTAEATQEISSRIREVQETTAASIASIGRIVEVINEINDIVNGVASAIEEQSTTTREISSNVSQAASGIQEVNENISQITSVSADVTRDVAEVNRAAEQTHTGIQRVKEHSATLIRIADRLNKMINRFKI